MLNWHWEVAYMLEREQEEAIILIDGEAVVKRGFHPNIIFVNNVPINLLGKVVRIKQPIIREWRT